MYMEAPYHSLKVPIMSCVVEQFRLAANGTPCFARVDQVITAFSTKMVSVAGDEWCRKWLYEQLEANRALIINICFAYQVNSDWIVSKRF